VKVSRRTSLVAAAVAVLLLAGLAALVGSGASQASPKASNATFLASLVSDIGKFNDRSFNQSQLEGLKRAKKELKIKILPLQSNSTSDYTPNFNTAVRSHANITIAAGFLLADTLENIADQFPNSKFAITDYCAKGAAAKCITGNVLTRNHPNVMGLDYAANQSGCLVGYLAAEMARKAHKTTIGAVGGLHIPPVDIWIAGYKFCARMYSKKIKVLIDYSGSFTESDKCKTLAENQIAQGSYVEFQVAGGCGLGTLTAAAQHKIWGIGVDKDQFKDAKRVLTSGVKHVDLGVFNVIKATKSGKFKGNRDLQFTLKNHGMGVGKINPAVPKKFITAMNKIKARIIKGTLKVPTKLK
jgi:basic membrane protein A